MNRKSNPWLALIAAILLAVILVCCIGCSSGTAAETDGDRFACEFSGDGFGSVSAYIITDTETGVQYLFVASHNRGGLTQLLPGEEVPEA